MYTVAYRCLQDEQGLPGGAKGMTGKTHGMTGKTGVFFIWTDVFRARSVKSYLI